MNTIINLNILNNDDDIFEEHIDLTIFNELNVEATFCVGQNTLSRLLAYDNYPIANKNIAIKNILQFLKYLGQFEQSIFPIKTSIWVDFFTTIHYKRYMTILYDLNILSFIKYSDGGKYIAGERYNLYTFMNGYKHEENLCLYIITKDSGKVTLTKDKGIYSKKMMNTVKKTAVNFRGALIDEIKHYKDVTKCMMSLRARISTLLSFTSTRFISTGEKSGRVSHSMSSLSRVSRKHLTYKGLSFAGVDIKNAQPLFLCYYLRQNNMPVDSTYVEDCQSGLLYERFQGIVGSYNRKKKKEDKWINVTVELDLTGTDARGKIKEELFQSIYFHFCPASLVAKKFKELYPETYKSLEMVAKNTKEDDSNLTLAARLQRIESEMMTDIIPESSAGYFTLYDAIYMTSPEDVFKVQELIKEKFSLYDLIPTLSFE